MVDVTTRTLAVGDEPAVSGASWGAIFAGAAVSLAVTLVVISFGVGLGLSVVSPWETAGVSATTFKIGTGLFLIVVAMISSSLGGYLAGRLRTRWIGVHTDEVFFRDTAHGFAAWAVATIIGVTVLATPATSLLGNAASGALQGAGNAASGPTEMYTDQLLRMDANNTAPAAQSQPAQPGDAANTQAAPANGNRADNRGDNGETRAELGRLLASGLQSGNIAADDRAYASRLIANRTGISQADADKRVNDVIVKAKGAADAARKAAAQLAFWLAASMIIGAFCASIAAAEGGALRDGYKTWRRV